MGFSVPRVQHQRDFGGTWEESPSEQASPVLPTAANGNKCTVELGIAVCFETIVVILIKWFLGYFVFPTPLPSSETLCGNCWLQRWTGNQTRIRQTRNCSRQAIQAEDGASREVDTAHSPARAHVRKPRRGGRLTLFLQLPQLLPELHELLILFKVGVRVLVL